MRVVGLSWFVVSDRSDRVYHSLSLDLGKTVRHSQQA